MIKIGDFNTLAIARVTPHGAYLSDADGSEILMPSRYIEDGMRIGDMIRVFVYTDSEDRPVATTETPFAKVGEFAFLQTVQVNRVGAFLDWGLPKNLLVPFKEQKIKMFPGGIYLVYVYLDHNTGRVVASARVEKFLDNLLPDYSVGDEVKALVIGRNQIGYLTIVDNLHRGIIYANETYKPIEIGRQFTAYVKHVREADAKIDLTLTAPGTVHRVEQIAQQIIKCLNTQDGLLNITDKSSPEEIKERFECSKKDFKKAVGMLYKQRKIRINDNDIMLTGD